jgi:hypothetical protein
MPDKIRIARTLQQKSQTPNTKSQGNSKSQMAAGEFDAVGISLLFGFWWLGF